MSSVWFLARYVIINVFISLLLDCLFIRSIVPPFLTDWICDKIDNRLGCGCESRCAYVLFVCVGVCVSIYATLDNRIIEFMLLLFYIISI